MSKVIDKKSAITILIVSQFRTFIYFSHAHPRERDAATAKNKPYH